MYVMLCEEFLLGPSSGIFATVKSIHKFNIYIFNWNSSPTSEMVSCLTSSTNRSSSESSANQQHINIIRFEKDMQLKSLSRVSINSPLKSLSRVSINAQLKSLSWVSIYAQLKSLSRVSINSPLKSLSRVSINAQLKSLSWVSINAQLKSLSRVSINSPLKSMSASRYLNCIWIGYNARCPFSHCRHHFKD